jgi:hypothetical protein
MSQMQTPKSKQKTRHLNVLESLKELSSSTGESLKNDLIGETTKDFAKQLFGDSFLPKQRHFSGELLPQEQVGIDSILSGEQAKNEILEKQLFLERQLRAEEEALREKKGNELKLSLHVLMQEMQQLAQADASLSQEIQIAAIQAPSDPGTYHVFFVQRLVEYLRGHVVKAQEAAVWLHAVNKRSAKKSFWGQYKISGGRRLMSSEDYAQRSAG